MAGLGHKTFTRETLSSAEVNGYLMDQAVMRFASVAARNATLTAPTDGMVTYLEDVDDLEYREGGAYWRPVSGTWRVHTSGALPSTGTRDGDRIYSAVYQCSLIRTGGTWRQATTVQVTSLTAYVASLTAAGITSVHNGFQVFDTDDNQLYVAAGSFTFIRAAGAAGSRVTTDFPTASSGWSYVAGGTTWVRDIGGATGSVYMEVTKTGATINVDIKGEIPNTQIGTVPAAYKPLESTALFSSATGRPAHGYMNTDGEVFLCSVAPGAGIVAGESISLAGTYRLATAQVVL
jgi:hypothetical protein